MLYLLITIPWVLTVAALLYIIVVKERQHQDIDEDSDEDFFFEDDDESQKEVVRVAVYEDKAYWVYDNVFYESEITREPDFSTAQAVDTMSLSPKELNKLMAILDELQNNERE